MLKKVKKYIHNHNLFDSSDKILLAVSGGIDSMVLLDLLQKMNCNFAVAHCNFNLRGQESDGDEAFVSSYCEEKKIELFKISFQTKTYANEKKISIQMAARELRYNWFQEIYQANDFKYIALAHHANDVVETFHINLSRGTGIKGLSGIKAKIGNLIRPLLFATRDEIIGYQKENKLDFREDSSNSSVKYARNKIRHEIIPSLEKINSAYSQNVLKSIENLLEVEKIYNQQIEEKRKEIVIFENHLYKINIDKLLKTAAPKTFLFEFIREFGFESDNLEQIYESVTNQTGCEFLSENFILLKNRNEFIVKRKENAQKTDIFIDKNCLQLKINEINFTFSEFEKKQDFVMEKKQEIALLDFDKLEFPLQITNWKTGDYFYPLGMEKRKKISDFLIDKKISLFEKEKQLILKSKNEIVWMVGKQIDNRFKLTQSTKKILRIEITNDFFINLQEIQ